jgi:hypothetical protein
VRPSMLRLFVVPEVHTHSSRKRRKSEIEHGEESSFWLSVSWS